MCVLHSPAKLLVLFPPLSTLRLVIACYSVPYRVLAISHAIVNHTFVCSQGGSKEIFHTNATSKETVLEITHRNGFVKLALRYGTPLVCGVL